MIDIPSFELAPIGCAEYDLKLISKEGHEEVVRKDFVSVISMDKNCSKIIRQHSF